MLNLKKLFGIKSDQKKKMPNFVATDSHKKIRVKSHWRKPKGLQNKKRLQKNGFGAVVKSGYGTPDVIRGAHRSGIFYVTVSCLKDLDNVPKDNAIVVSGSLGGKKRLSILNKAKEKGISVLNFDATKKISQIEDDMKIRKANKSTKSSSTTTKKTSAKPKSASKKEKVAKAEPKTE